MEKALKFIEDLLRLAPAAIQAEEDIASIAQRAIKVVQAGGPTADDWDWLHAAEARLRAMLRAPL